ncbi:glycerophosphoryl diester phosphodiesterase [Aneurinibacillus soli]|uniref:Glycerophosphoryl diester phosphodiesterase n=1 Tax=Aneurinibacillus soli TaxID=1500254 RepID=A0A0U5AZ75_9BACL|nr:glycerophosphodiester phosphodiesterase family protein [Aneurinibacillus soli]PYE63755.1 glycerophosphoryl diester phosphodiesterase [Aneurinibacillus soli]BAU27312.1 Glycerophosphoryl diester phosphodiesterase [Aneurinibacillus soli]
MNDFFLIYAHRGASATHPENTMPAFAAALRQGATGIELDVQLTRDGELVVFHDWSLKRIFGKPGHIRDYTLAELRRFDAGRWFDSRFAGISIPTLNDVLDRAAAKSIMLNIELKNFFSFANGIEQKVSEAIARHNLQDQTVISTFNPLSLELLQQTGCGADTAFLYFGHLREAWRYAHEYNCAYLHPPVHEVTESFVEACREHDIKIVPYQVNTLPEITRMIELGTDGIITSQPTLAHRLLHGEKRRKPKR